jgi:ABC-type nitrate/sulfonate/bicarbonate transport system permease component
VGIAVGRQRSLNPPRISERWYGPIALLVGLVVWELAGRFLDPLMFAPPTAVVGAWVDLVLSGELPDAATASLLALAMGFGSAVIVGLAMGTAMGLSRHAKYVLDPYVNTGMAAPTIALLPIIVLAFGLELSGRAVVIFVFAVFTIIVNTEAEMRSVKPQYLEMARSFGLSWTQTLLEVRLRSALPGIMVGMRVALIRAISGMVVAELFLALTGIGFLLRVYGTSFQTAELFAVIATVVIAAMIASGILNHFARRFSAWQQGMRWE